MGMQKEEKGMWTDQVSLKGHKVTIVCMYVCMYVCIQMKVIFDEGGNIFNGQKNTGQMGSHCVALVFGILCVVQPGLELRSACPYPP